MLKPKLSIVRHCCRKMDADGPACYAESNYSMNLIIANPGENRCFINYYESVVLEKYVSYYSNLKYNQ
jgi:hypothetical protein